MLSEDKQVVLQERVASWGSASGIPETVQRMVVALGAHNPQSQEDLQRICKENLWSTEAIDWYLKFIEYLESEKAKDAVQAPVGSDDPRQLIAVAIAALQKALEVLNG